MTVLDSKGRNMKNNFENQWVKVTDLPNYV